MITIIVAFRHQTGKLKDLRDWLNNGNYQMIASTLGMREKYLGFYLIEGDPTYTIELHSATTNPNIIEELDNLNTENFTRGQTVMKLLWRYVDQTVPPRIRYQRAIHEPETKP